MVACAADNLLCRFLFRTIKLWAVDSNAVLASRKAKGKGSGKEAAALGAEVLVLKGTLKGHKRGV